jgi:hypothetical protein
MPVKIHINMSVTDWIMDAKELYEKSYQCKARNVIIGKGVYQALLDEIHSALSEETWKRVFHSEIGDKLIDISGLVVYIDWDRDIYMDMGAKYIMDDGRKKYVRQNNE